jgi:hypothetical protein
MWPVATVARMAVSLRNTATNTPLQTLEIIGGDTMGLLKGAFTLAFWPVAVPVLATKKIIEMSSSSTSNSTTKKHCTVKKTSTNHVSINKSQAQHERNKMTNAVRERIKARDNYTCQKCGISLFDEPHLLLEVDHIIPIAKGGKTVDSNLQCLCWKCNRSKGATTQFFTGTIPCWKCAHHDTAICNKCPNGEYFKEER